MKQLDIFADSRDTMLRNDLIDALLGGDAAPARAARSGLAAESPRDDCLADADALIEVLSAADDSLFAAADPACAERARIQTQIAPAALRRFGADAAAAAWLAPFWRRLAQRARALPLRSRPDQFEGHAAALWLEAREWTLAAQAVERIESWRRVPVALGWMLRARWHQAGSTAIRPLLVELAWLAPARFESVARGLGDTVLAKLLRRFESNFDGFGGSDDWVWFPAWLLIDEPTLAAETAAADAARHGRPERAWALMQALLRLERQGRRHEVIELRRELREVHPALLAAYLRTRA